MILTQKKILHVDDDAAVARAVGDMLGMAGYHVVKATNAQDGLRKMRSNQFDLIILDMNLPGMSGETFLNQICGEDGQPPVPVLLFTAFAQMVSDDVRSRVSGFLVKPADGDAIIAEINRILGQTE